MDENLRIDNFRIEPVRQDARRLASGDFKLVGAANEGTPLLKAAYATGESANLAFVEGGEKFAFPAFVTFFDESDGVVTAIIRPAAPPESIAA
jgi:hypothetical protein